MEQTVTAIVLSWNDCERVLALLRQLGALDVQPARILVVDNGSSDGTADRIAESFPRCEVLRLHENRGFAGAVNRGIERAMSGGARWVWLLNTDLVLPAQSLAMLMRAAEADRRCGMAAPVFVGIDDSVEAWGGGTINLWTGMLRHGTSDTPAPHYLLGACLLVRAEMLETIGTLDEGFFFYWEDVELGFRARRSGWSLAVAADCRVRHLEGSTLGRWSAQRWRLLFAGLSRFLGPRAPVPPLAVALRLLHHSASMARHGRWQAIAGAWSGAAEGLRARRAARA